VRNAERCEREKVGSGGIVENAGTKCTAARKGLALKRRDAHLNLCLCCASVSVLKVKVSHIIGGKAFHFLENNGGG